MPDSSSPGTDPTPSQQEEEVSALAAVLGVFGRLFTPPDPFKLPSRPGKPEKAAPAVLPEDLTAPAPPDLNEARTLTERHPVTLTVRTLKTLQNSAAGRTDLRQESRDLEAALKPLRAWIDVALPPAALAVVQAAMALGEAHRWRQGAVQMAETRPPEEQTEEKEPAPPENRGSAGQKNRKGVQGRAVVQAAVVQTDAPQPQTPAPKAVLPSSPSNPITAEWPLPAPIEAPARPARENGQYTELAHVRIDRLNTSLEQALAQRDDAEDLAQDARRGQLAALRERDSALRQTRALEARLALAISQLSEEEMEGAIRSPGGRERYLLLSHVKRRLRDHFNLDLSYPELSDLDDHVRTLPYLTRTWRMTPVKQTVIQGQDVYLLITPDSQNIPTITTAYPRAWLEDQGALPRTGAVRPPALEEHA